MSTIQIKRIYEPYTKADDLRVLVDRLWPRGVKKEEAHVDIWMKDVAPSPNLRTWFNHEPEKWKVFSKKYTEELQNNNAVQELLDQIISHKKTTLLYAAKDEQHTHALVLQAFLQSLL
jgi:uncharacterized protein YeaO (DUF488 family)